MGRKEKNTPTMHSEECFLHFCWIRKDSVLENISVSDKGYSNLKINLIFVTFSQIYILQNSLHSLY